MLIPFKSLIDKYDIHPKGVLHVGSNLCQEANDYYNNGVEQTIWVEALPEIYDRLGNALSNHTNWTALLACITDRDDDEVEFHVANNEGQSSSILEFGTHTIHHPSVYFTHSIKLKTVRLDTLLKRVDLFHYDFLAIDLQGAELLALKSMGDLLNYFTSCYIEVNRESLYKGCPMFEEIESYLKEFGFVTKEVCWTDWNWGDAYFQKETI